MGVWLRMMNRSYGRCLHYLIDHGETTPVLRWARWILASISFLTRFKPPHSFSFCIVCCVLDQVTHLYTAFFFLLGINPCCYTSFGLLGDLFRCVLLFKYGDGIIWWWNPVFAVSTGRGLPCRVTSMSDNTSLDVWWFQTITILLLFLMCIVLLIRLCKDLEFLQLAHCLAWSGRRKKKGDGLLDGWCWRLVCMAFYIYPGKAAPWKTGSVGCDEKYTSLGRADLESSKGGLCWVMILWQIFRGACVSWILSRWCQVTHPFFKSSLFFNFFLDF